MKRIILYILPILMTVLTSCHSTIHEHPDAGNALVTLTMNVKTAGPDIYSVIEYTGSNRVTYSPKDYIFPNSRSDMSSKLTHYLEQSKIDITKWDMRLVWELYDGTREEISSGDAVLMQRDTAIIDFELDVPYHTIQFEAPSGRYTLLAWSDFVPKGTTADYYYDTENVNMLLSDLDRRRACLDNDQRDCFAKAFDFEVDRVDYSGQERYYETTLIRPQGRYVILATDYDKYLDLTDVPVEQNTVNLAYPSYINIGYSLLAQRPNESTINMTYSFTPRVYEFDDQIAICVGDDYSFVNGEVSYVYVNMEVISPAGKRISNNKNIEIPLYADRLTVVVGNFFASSGGEGGIKIDDKFEDEIVIPYAVGGLMMTK